MSMAVRKPEGLLLVKQLYEDARLLSDRDDSLSLSKAVIILDLSVEQMLNHIVLNLDPNLNINAAKAGREIERKTLWGNAATCLGKKGAGLTESREISNLHVLRNLVQHSGTEPAKSEVKRYVQAAAIMLSNAFKDAYGLKFDSFRLWDFVSNNDLRKWMQHYDDALREGDPVKCIAGCEVAYRRIIHAVQLKTRGYSHHRSAGESIKRYLPANFNDYSSETGRAFSAVIKEFESLQEEMEKRLDLLESENVAIGIGLPVMDTRRFLQASDGVIVHDMGGRLQILLTKDSDHERQIDRATFMLNYLSRLIYLIEEGYPGALDELKLELREQIKTT